MQAWPLSNRAKLNCNHLSITDKKLPVAVTCMFCCYSYMALFPPKCCRHPIPLMSEVLIDPICYVFRQFLQVLFSLFPLSVFCCVAPLSPHGNQTNGNFVQKVVSEAPSFSHQVCLPRPYSTLVSFVLLLFVKSFYLKQKSVVFSKKLFLIFCSRVVKLLCLIFIGS